MVLVSVMWIEDYVFVGDGCSVVFVVCDGSIDWLCWLDFDLLLCFVVFVGMLDNGWFWIVLCEYDVCVMCCYLLGIVIFEMMFDILLGCIMFIDWMSWNVFDLCLICSVKGECGMVDVDIDFGVCFDYGSVLLWCWCFGWCWWMMMGGDVMWFDMDVWFDV